MQIKYTFKDGGYKLEYETDPRNIDHPAFFYSILKAARQIEASLGRDCTITIEY